jgi:protocatechuate 4,5-dioxygenase alpha chain
MARVDDAKPKTDGKPVSRNWRLAMPSAESYHIDRVLFDVQHNADHRKRFQCDPHTYLRAVPLSPERKADLVANAFGSLYIAGANPYLLRAHCLAMNVSEEDYLAQMRAVVESS